MSSIALGAARARAGDRTRSDEVTALVEREASGLLGYFLRRTLSRDDAADLLGETLLVVWRKEASIPGDDTRARMWMYGIARKVLSGHRRSAVRENALAQRLTEELAAIAPPPPDEESEEVRAAIARLAPVDQEILTLVYWEGFALAEVAQILHLRAATVRSRHARARARLRDELGAADAP